MGLCCCSSEEVIDKNDYFGSNSKRKCRDLPCLFIFFLFIIGMIVAAVLGFYNGEIKQYYYGTDRYGNMCGDANENRKVKDDKRYDLEEEKFVYFPDPSDLRIAYCLKACPTVDDIGKSMVFYDGESTLSPYPCTDVLNRCLPDLKAVEELTADQQVLLPSILDEDFQKMLNLLTSNSWFTRAVSDIAELWWLILLCIAAAFVVGIIWMFFVRIFAGVITWFMIFVCFIALLAATIYVWITADNLDADSTNLIYEFIEQETLRKVLRVFSIILMVVTILFFFLVIFLRKRVRLAIAVIKEASSSMGLSPCLSFFPILQFFFYAIFLTYWIVVLLFLASAHSSSETIDNIEVMGYKPSVSVMYLGLFHLFGGLWIFFWMSGIGQTTVAGVIASHYWTHGKDDGSLTTMGSLHRTLRFSSGSVAFGSFLIATMTFIRILFEYFSRIKAKAAKKGIKWLSCLLKIVSCCIWCFEKIVKWISESAYIMIAIAGKSFLKSAVQAVSLQAANFLRILVLRGIAFFTLNVTRLAIAMICTLIATVVSYNYSKLSDILEPVYETSTLHYWYIPVIIVFLGSFFVAGVFTNVFSISINTVMLSFCEDESSDGKAVNQKFASLMKPGKVDDKHKEKDDGIPMKKKVRRHSSDKVSKSKKDKPSKSKSSSKKSSRDDIMLN